MKYLIMLIIIYIQLSIIFNNELNINNEKNFLKKLYNKFKMNI